MKLTKSQFLQHLQCAAYLWLYKFNKATLQKEVEPYLQRIFDEGYEIENQALQLFPNGQQVNGFYQKAVSHTKVLVRSGAKTIFQATAMTPRLMCMADIITLKRKTWNIFEVKSSTEVKEIHLIDLAFQKICFEEAGYNIGKLHIIHVNNRYVKKGKINPKQLLKIEDVTPLVLDLIEQVKLDIDDAIDFYQRIKKADLTNLERCINPLKCPINFCNQDIPENSIYSIAGGLRGRKLKLLIDQGILEIKDIPNGFLTNRRSILHRKVVTSKKVHLEKDSINKELNKLKYPLYFIDYETANPAIPVYDGYRPYQRIVFQFSLHVQKQEGNKLDHYEFLADGIDDPTSDLLKALKDSTGDIGTWISWNAIFEKGCNSEMAERCPKYSEFLKKINESMFDLMQIFRKGFFVHKDFGGSASIKKVLPVIAPELNYSNLEIKEGGSASESWRQLPSMGQKERMKVRENLLKYCKRDTYAMVAILDFLKSL